MATRRRKARTITHTSAVAYLRVSSEAQEASGLGLDAQRATIATEAARRGVHVAAWCVDAGVSGTVPGSRRAGFLEALSAIKAHSSTLLLVAKSDRLSRGSASDFENLEFQIIRAGAVVGYCDGTPEGRSAAAEMQRGMFQLFAKFERNLISERTSAALQAKKARGERYNKQIPYGFLLADDGKRLESDRAEQETLARMRAMRAEGLSLRAITARLNAGPPPRSSKAWYLTTVAGLLAG